MKENYYSMVADGRLSIEEAFEKLRLNLEREKWKDERENEPLELSVGQMGLWAYYHSVPDSYAYNVPVVFTLKEKVELRRFQDTVTKLMQYHPCLRTVIYEENGKPYQKTMAIKECGYQEIDISGCSEKEIRQLITEKAQEAFELTDHPLFKVCFFTSGDQRIVLFTIHHIIFDGISSDLLLRNLELIYQGKERDCREAAGYGEFVAWQKVMTKGKQGLAAQEFWRERLKTKEIALKLPYDFPQSKRLYQGGHYKILLSGEQTELLRNTAIRLEVTLSSLMFTLYQILLFHITKEAHISIVMPVSGRAKSRFENTIGYFMNLIILTHQINGDTAFETMVREIQRSIFKVLEYGDYPYQKVLQDIRKERGTPVKPGNTAYYFQNWLMKEEEEEQYQVIDHMYEDIRQEGEFELTLEIMKKNKETALYFKYDPSLFKAESIEKMAEEFCRITDVFCNATTMKIKEYKQSEQTGEWIHQSKKTEQTRHTFTLFSKMVNKYAQKTAVVFEDKHFTYEEIHKESLKLAGYLKQQGVKRGSVIAIYMKRSEKMLIGLLGIMASGASYIPCDPLYPTERIHMMLADGDAEFILTERELVEQLNYRNILNLCYENAVTEESVPWVEEQEMETQEDIAYIIFTSGSTGRPKGVKVYHKGLTNFLLSMARKPGFYQDDYLLAITTVCFDISYLELYLPLISGGTVEVVSDQICRDGIRLKNKLESSPVTVVQATPATWQMLLQAEWEKRLPIRILCGGEALSVMLAEQLLQLADEVWNMYGPTETTIWSTIKKIEQGQKITIGHPIDNTDIYILDERERECPDNVEGELCIGGMGLAWGYANRVEETKKRFINWNGREQKEVRIYKTGDLARRLPNGEIECLGRKDFQVKIRGYRVELGEIEAAVKAIDGIRDAAVVLKEQNEKSRRLTAYLIMHKDRKPDPQLYRQILAEKLPHYMVPAQYIATAFFPQTLNGKIDRLMLSQRGNPGAESKDDTEQLKAKITDELKQIIGGILEEALHDADVHTGLVELGFDSISLTTLVVAINQKFHLKLDATIFYEYFTIQALTDYLFITYQKEMRKRYQMAEAADSMPEGEPERPGHEAVASERSGAKIAVIGIAGALPGEKGLTKFWKVLEEGGSTVTPIPAERWNYEEFKTSQDAEDFGFGSFIKDIYHFDPLFFGLSPREAETMDPQQRLFLRTAWEVIEDAGYKASELSGSRTGIYVGCTGTDYLDVARASGRPIEAHSISGISGTIIPNRISYLLNFHGPSRLINTACSSSLVAVHHAVTELQNGSCDMAIAGGVNLILSPFTHEALSKTGMLSPDGRCRTFDESANGYVRGEGVAAVLLKPFDNAVRDGDHIYGVILGSSENHGGKATSLTAPNINAEADLIAEAFQKSGIDPRTVTYVEAHGTGTALGDPIEINALKKAFETVFTQQSLDFHDAPYCGIGSVKANIGHLEASAGIAGFMKVILAMKHGKLPGNIHLRHKNELIDTENSPFYLLKETKVWEHLKDDSGDDIPYRAGISSFGFGGVNAHVIVEEYPDHGQSEESTGEKYAHLVLLSAKSEKSLIKYMDKFLVFLKELSAQEQSGEKPALIRNIAFTLMHGREMFGYRAAFIAETINELIEKLNACLRQEKAAGIYRGNIFDSSESRLSIQEKEVTAESIWENTAELWVKGADCTELFKEYQGRRISLPGYAFEEIEYGVSAAFHPLIVSGYKESVPLIDDLVPVKKSGYSAGFVKNVAVSNRIAADHIVNGQPIFPGTAYMEMVAEGIRKLIDRSFKITRINWLTPMVMESDRKVLLYFKNPGDRGIDFEIHSEESNSTIHAAGTVGYCDNSAEKAERIDIDHLTGLCEHKLSGIEYYAKIRAAGIDYRTYFQGIEQIWFHETLALSRLRLPDFQNIEHYVLHPVLGDLALQTMAILMQEAHEPKVPFMAENIEYIRPMKAEGYACAFKQDDGTFRVFLCNDQGEICVKFDKVMNREMPSKKVSRYYYPRWSVQGELYKGAKPPEAQIKRNTLIVTDSKEQYWAGELADYFARAQIISIGNYVCDRREEFQRLLKEVLQHEPLEQIYYIVSEDSPADGQDFDDQKVLNFFNFVKALETFNISKLNFVVATIDNYRITGIEAQRPFSAAVNGLAATAALEYPHWNIKCIDVESEPESSSALVRSLLVWTEQKIMDGCKYAIRNQRLYKRVLLPAAELSASGGEGFKPGGVYFIIGGLGGIGFSLSEFLIKRWKARIALVGRREEGQEVRQQMAGLLTEGEVIYIQADVADYQALCSAGEQAVRRFGRIDGVIHSALVLDDRQIREMTEESLRQVISAKTKGSYNLMRVFKESALDFMLFFSSVNGIIPGYAQGNYTAGCVFQDTLAEYYRDKVNYPIKVINWSFWEETGIVSGEKYRNKFQRIGLRGIKTRDGIRDIERIMDGSVPQVVVIDAENKILETMGCDQERSVSAAKSSSVLIIPEFMPISPEDEKILNDTAFYINQIETYGVLHAVKFLLRIGVVPNQEINIDELMGRLKITGQYKKLFVAIVDILRAYGYARINNGVAVFQIEEPDETAFQEITGSITEDRESLLPYLELLEICFKDYGEILTGKKDYMEVLFPGGSKKLVEPIYKGNTMVDYFNQKIAECIFETVKAILSRRPDTKVNILEIGAGTGGTSAAVFRRMEPFKDQITYYYTDISASFTIFGAEQFHEEYSYVRFKVLDIEKPIEKQGFDRNDIDICFASNCIHATGDITNSLGNIKCLLKHNGILLLNELTVRQVFSTLTFGLTSGWWMFNDENKRIPGSPLLTSKMWMQQLYRCGYHHVTCLTGNDQNNESGQCIIMGISDGLIESEAAVQESIAIDEKHFAMEDQLNNKNSLQESVSQYLLELFASTLKAERESLKGNVPYESYGIDSMLIIELNKKFEDLVGEFPSTVLFEFNTLDKLADYLMEHYKNKLLQLFSESGQEEESIVRTDETEPAVPCRDIEKQQSIHPKLKKDELPETTDIAVIGIAGKYPKSKNIKEFWENLVQGKEFITEIPPERWDKEAYFSEQDNEAGKSYTKWGAFLDHVYAFDAEFFEIDGELADRIDPQERLFMEVVWELLEDSGYPYRSLSAQGNSVGVYIGTMYGDYGTLASADNSDNYNDAQSSYWLIPNRISNYYDFQGPSMAVDTACSASMTAIHLACQSIRSGECDCAIAGGINLILDPRHYIKLASVHNLSVSKQTKCFGEGADGFVAGEGVGAVLLKPLRKARQDGDRIYGVIKGSAINTNGATGSFMASSPAAQDLLIHKAIENSGIDPRTINYMEAHGTGTMFGDSIEIRGLEKAFSRYTNDLQFCAIGSVKSNIGHLEAASGISALTKVLMQMKYRKLLPVHRFDTLSSYVKLEQSPFYIQQELTDWERVVSGNEEMPRRAGISSFGAGGSNAHIIVEEYEQRQSSGTVKDKPVIIPISAKNAAQLRQAVVQLRDTVLEKPDIKLSDIAFTLQTARYHMKIRLAVVAELMSDFRHSLDCFLENKHAASIFSGEANKATDAVPMDVPPCHNMTDIKSIAKRYAEGENFLWKNLYRQGDGRLTDLPGYPFAQTMHSFISFNKTKTAYNFGEDRYHYRYGECFLKDHISFGDQVLLGVTHLSLGIEALSKLYKDITGLQIKKFLLNEPVIVKPDETVEIKIQINQEEQRFISLYRKNQETGYRVAAEGQFAFVPLSPLQDIRKPYEHDQGQIIYSKEDIYKHKWPGVYGSSLQTVLRASVLSDQVYAKLCITDEIQKDGHSYQIHPAVLDGAIVSRCALLDEEQERVPMIPLMIKSLTVCQATDACCHSVVERVHVNEEMWELNAKIYDERGKLVVNMEGIILKKVRDTKLKEEHFQLLKEEHIQLLNADVDKASETAFEKTLDCSLESEIKNYIIRQISEITHSDWSNADITKNFLDMGVQSLELVALAQRMEKDIQEEIYPTIFFEYPNIYELTQYLMTNYQNKTERLLSDSNQPGVNARVETTRDDIAVIGISGIMPGSKNLNEFFESLRAKKELITEIPGERWDWQEFYKGDSEDATKTNVTRAGFIDAADCFDHGFFGISPREAALMDPQQRISLELVWKVIEDAGYNPENLSGSRTGLFIGVAGHDYSNVLNESYVESQSQALTGNTHNILTGRISFLLNLLGPSEPIDTACSSSLVAIHRGIQNLQDGSCDMVIAGGVNLILHPSLFIAFDNIGILSNDGKCRVFDKDADGTVRGEGAGFVLLKALSKAEADGDHIYGVIKGSAVNHGGHASSLTAPSQKQQAQVIAEALGKAGVPPETVTYIESHGTGTKLGDPIEIDALKTAYRKLWTNEQPFEEPVCGIGALKSNIGHLETASGIASLIKVLFCMKHKTLVGSPNYHTLNPYVKISGSPFYILEDTREWRHLLDEDGKQVPYRAGISAFGFSGVNAHIVVEEYCPAKPETRPHDGKELILLSAKGKQELKESAGLLKDYLVRGSGEYGKNNRYGNGDGSGNSEPLPQLKSIAYTLQTGRAAMTERAAFVVSSIEELVVKLNCFDPYQSGQVNYAGGDAVDQEEITGYLLSKNLDKLAELWLHGVQIKQWDLLHQGAVEKVNLPAYPFRKNRHWVKKRERTPGAPEQASVLGEFIDSNISTIAGPSFKKELKKTDWFIREHKLNGTETLPAVIYMEMARMAAALANQNETVQGMQNVVWSRLLKLEEDRKTVEIHMRQDNGWQFYIGEKGHENVQGTIIYGSGNRNDERISIDRYLAECSLELGHDEFYQYFKMAGFEYGNRFKGINFIRFSETLAVSAVTCNSEKDGNAHYVLNPVIMEGALQTAGHLVNAGSKGAAPGIPFALEALEIYHEFPAFCYVVATLNQEMENETVKHLNIIIADESGRILARIHNYMTREAVPQSSGSCKTYRPDWIRKNLYRQPSTEKPLLVLFSDHPETDEIAVKWGGSNMKIRSGAAFRQLSLNEYEMHPGDEDSGRSLLNEIKKRSGGKAIIINAWNLSAKFTGAAEEIRTQCLVSIENLLAIHKVLMKDDDIRTLAYIYLYDLHNPLSAAVNGFIKSIGRENKRLQCKTIAFEQADIAGTVSSELMDQNEDMEILYRNSERYVRRMIESAETMSAPNTGLKQGGTYWITGGAGGLGLKIARYLAGEYQANILLTGRSSLNEAIRKQIDTLNQSGGAVIYQKSDITVPQEAEAALDELKRVFGHLDGIFHCAGVITDKLAMNKTAAEMEQVLSAKVNGTITLDRITRNEALDFILLFSSISSVFGNVGQCDYAYANCFMDQFTGYREALKCAGNRTGRTIAVNWPYLEDGQMGTAEQLRKLTGLEPLAAHEFWEKLQWLAAADSGEIMLLKGSSSVINRLLETEQREQHQQHTCTLLTQGAELLKVLRQDIIKLVSDISQIPASQLADNIILDDYGFDSIVMTEFANELRKLYKINITPAVFFELAEPTIKNLCEYLILEYGEQLQDQPGGIKKDENKEVKAIPPDGDSIFSRSNSQSRRNSAYEPVAIIGLAGKMPQSDDLEEFWEHIINNEDMITIVPEERWNWEEYYGDPHSGGKTLCKWGGFMKNAASFDAKFFNISPKEAILLDPQQRLLLETAWSSIENAGYRPSAIAKSKTGVFIGITNSEYTERFSKANLKSDGHAISSNAHFLTANRISYFLDLCGPSETIDTACSSAAVAIHRAAVSLQTGECTLALAGGVNVLASPSGNIGFDASDMLAHDGKVKTFDQHADGFIRSEGTGILVMKLLTDAVSDKDVIYGVIQGSAVKHGGRSKSITAPNPISQAKVIADAIVKSGIDPHEIDYIELQGTGSLLGDNVELQGIRRAYEQLNVNKDERAVCGLGSVKTNAGHLESASGMASIFKVLLAMKHGIIPASIHCQTLNPFLDLDNSNFYYVTENKAWPRNRDETGNEKPRYAGINVFGAGGTNAHLLLGEYIPVKRPAAPERPQIFVFSAKTPDSLFAVVKKAVAWISKLPESEMGNAAYTLQTAREELKHRIAVVAEDAKHFRATMELLLDSHKSANVFCHKLEEQPANVFYYNLEAIEQSLEEIIDDDDLQREIVTRASIQGNYHKIAGLWVRGVHIPWEILHNGMPRYKIELPTYCFEKHNYWIELNNTRDPVSETVISPSHLPAFMTQDFDRKSMIEEYTKAVIADFLGLEKEEIKVTEELAGLGFDSIMLIKLKYQLETDLKIEIPVGDLSHCNTIKDFTNYLNGKDIKSISEKASLKPKLQNLLEGLDIDILGDEELDEILKLLQQEYV